jgi:hypothetical protein
MIIMAKVNARGAYEVATVTAERHFGPTTYGGPETTRVRFVLRSDGAILSKIVWNQPDGGERRAHNGTFTHWGNRTIKADHRNRETLVRVLARYGYAEVTAEQLTAERKATAKGAADKRKANQGPEGSAAQWEALHNAAHRAGMAAGEAVTPMPMVVVEHANQLDDNSPIVRSYAPVMDGPCGFAYVTVRPATGSFARWAKANRGWFAAYGGGLQLSVGAFNQSVTRKSAYASAFAAVLREAGVSAYGSSRMD